MSVLSELKNWLDALRLPARVTLGLFFVCVVLLILYRYNVITFGIFGDNTTDILIIVAVLFGVLTLSHLGALLVSPITEKHKQSLLTKRREIRRQEHEADRDEREAAALARLDHLSEHEIRLVADALRENSQSIYIYSQTPHAATLISKDLLYTPGGTYHQDYYPFTFHDFAWQELLIRKDEFIAKDDENKRREAE